VIDGREEEHVAALDEGARRIVDLRFDGDELDAVGQATAIELILQLPVLGPVETAHASS
jgi:hypothetical protein